MAAKTPARRCPENLGAAAIRIAQAHRSAARGEVVDDQAVSANPGVAVAHAPRQPGHISVPQLLPPDVEKVVPVRVSLDELEHRPVLPTAA
jgi:hypothetical protein